MHFKANENRFFRGYQEKSWQFKTRIVIQIRIRLTRSFDRQKDKIRVLLGFEVEVIPTGVDYGNIGPFSFLF